MSRKLITPPTAEPVLLAEAKAHLRVTTASEDALIGTMIAAAREEAENELRRALITQIWEKYLDAFPEAVGLFLPPLQSVTSVKYVDVAGALQTLASSEYFTDDKQEPGWIIPAFGKSWPATRDQVNAVTVRFVCGYGADSTTVPNAIRNWILLRVGALYENRGSVVLMDGRVNVAALPAQFIDGLLDRYRIAVLA